MHDSAKYLLLQQIIYLWITFIALLLLMRYSFPSRKMYHIVNIALAIAGVLQFVAIVFVSLTMTF